MSTLHGPISGEVVTLVVPRREQFSVRVDDAGQGWADLTLMRSPRTPHRELVRTQLYVQYAGAQGLCRMSGELSRRPQDARLRVTGYGAGETLRFTQRGNIQLLRRADLLEARLTARIVVLPAGRGNHVAANATCVQISGGGLLVQGVPDPKVGSLFEFDLYLNERERPVTGTFRVDRMQRDGTVEASLSAINAHERSRLVHYAADRQRAA